MSLRLLICALLLVLAPITSQARIGETPTECASRYGVGQESEDPNTITYQKSGFLIIVIFYDGKASLVNVTKLARTALGKGEPMSDNEVSALLKANGGERDWKQSAAIDINKNWQTSDGELFARYRPLDGDVFITTKDHLLREQAKIKAQENKALEGF